MLQQLRIEWLSRDIEDMKAVLLTNVVGTFAVTKAFLPLLKQGRMKTILNISSDAGCLTQNASFLHDDSQSDAAMALSYRTSKVALNMGELFCHTAVAIDTISLSNIVITDQHAHGCTASAHVSSDQMQGLHLHLLVLNAILADSLVLVLKLFAAMCMSFYSKSNTALLCARYRQ